MSFLLAAFMMFQSAPPTGSISGSVVLAGSQSQSPLIMARVELSGGPLLPQVVRTDGQGRFAFAGLPPGSYRLRVTKDGFLRQEYSKRAAIVIKPDTPHKEVMFALEPAPTMGGHVMSEFGEPIANIQVQALRAVYGPHGERTFAPLASTLTDDRGDYRLYWLDAGDYIISASFVPPIKTPGNPNEPVPQALYAPTYYPNASDLANAQRIPLRAGDNFLALDFRLVRVRAVTVRGSTSLRDTRRATSITVRLNLAGDAAGTAQYATKSNDLGSFEIKSVAPGSYIATAESMVGTERYAASVQVIVRDRDENDVGLILSPGVQVPGRMTLDTGAAVDMSAAHVQLISTNPYLESFESATVQADGQFAVSRVQPGSYAIEAAVMPKALYIKVQRSGQTTLLGTPLAIAWESPPSLEIVLGTDGGRIDGAVADSAGKPFAGAQVVLVPNAERRARPDQYRVTSSDEDGKFDLRGIPPGAYQLFAWENVEERAWLNSEFMGKYLDLGTAITIAASAHAILQIPLIPEKQ